MPDATTSEESTPSSSPVDSWTMASPTANTVGTAAPIAWAKNPGTLRRPRAVRTRKMTAALTMLVRTTTQPPPASSDVPAPIAAVATVVTQRRYGCGARITESNRSRASATGSGSSTTSSTTSCRRASRVKSWFRARTMRVMVSGSAWGPRWYETVSALKVTSTWTERSR